MREVRIRDTLSGELRTLDPAGETGIYACGPTVYSRIHIGNARPFVVFSLLARFLSSEGYRAKLVVNVTDINDKIYDAARAAGEPSAEFAARMTRAYFEDTGRLGLGRPDAEPLATETIGEILELIAELIDTGHAYESGGDVYFKVRSFRPYGKLSNRRTEDMDQGEEAGSESLKQEPLDFALWKAHKEGEDTKWDSPWGPGRPGWHIECSAMAEAELGPAFAIHGGGSDLVFPHHENEIAQSEAAGRPFARVWMHNGMIESDAEKMSKSEGNIFQLSEALDRYGREAVVAYLISGHYRQPLAFGPQQMEQAVAQVERLRNFFREHPVGDAERPPEGVPSEQQRGGSAGDPPDARLESFREALADDFNTPRAMAEVFELVGEANREEIPGASEALAEMLELVGLESLAEAEQGGRCGGGEAAGGARGGSGGEGLRAGGRDSRPACGAWLGGSRWGGRGEARAQGLMASQIIYGRRPVEEAERGRRAVRRVWRAPDVSGEELERLCGSPDHQGVVAEVDPYPYADPGALLGPPDALIVALDQVQDPRNLGAVCRSAEFAGAAGVVIPERRAAEVTAVVCKASAGAVEHLEVAHVRNLADWLGQAKESGLLDLGGRCRRGPGALGRRPERPDGHRARRRGEGHSPSRRLGLRRPRRPAEARQSRLAERLRRGGRIALRGRPAAIGTSSTCNGDCKKVAIWG